MSPISKNGNELRQVSQVRNWAQGGKPFEVYGMLSGVISSVLGIHFIYRVEQQKWISTRDISQRRKDKYTSITTEKFKIYKFRGYACTRCVIHAKCKLHL